MTWQTKRLSEIADLCLGKMLDQKKNKGEPRPYLANLNVRWGSIDLEDLREMRFEDRELERYGLKVGDIVLCEGGEPGRCALWTGQVPDMMIQKALHRIRPIGEVDSRFLFYALFHKGKAGGFDAYFTGATIKHLPGEQLAKVEVVLPPLDTQRRIASILGAYDDLIEVNRRRVAVLEEMARGLFEEWFVRFRFPGHEGVEIVETPDGPLPQGWSVARLGGLCEPKTGIQTGPFGSQLHQEDYTDEGVPVTMPKNLIGLRIVEEGIMRIPPRQALGRACPDGSVVERSPRSTPVGRQCCQASDRKERLNQNSAIVAMPHGQPRGIIWNGPQRTGLPKFSCSGRLAAMRGKPDQDLRSSRSIRLEAWSIGIVQAIPMIVMAKVWFGY